MIRVHYPHNQSIDTEIVLPSSKSISNRLLILQFLSKESFSISNLSESDDTQNLKHQLYKIGHSSDDVIEINVQAAGTNMRFLTALLSTIENQKFIITGNDRMKVRPIQPLVEALRFLGADITYLEKEGFPPLLIKGKKLKGEVVSVKADISSQFVSALMLISQTLSSDLRILLEGKTVSYPYVITTAKLLMQVGIEVTWNRNEILIKKRKTVTELNKTVINVESDWSAASYWYAILSLMDDGKILLRNLQENSIQGDSVISNWFEDFGIKSVFINGNVLLTKEKNIQSDSYQRDFSSHPDLAQTFAVLLAAKKIQSKFGGLSTLRMKETDRIFALKEELKKFGVFVKAESDTFGLFPSHFHCSSDPIHTYMDHRMAMSMAMLSIVCNEIIIENEMVVSKSYPHFWEDMQKVGFEIQSI